ncbi:hypothetical protein ATY79_14750 [Rhizobium sp. R693]|nr:hypothetical protein ATY79_14750 [Rhizobium sp. R693]
MASAFLQVRMQCESFKVATRASMNGHSQLIACSLTDPQVLRAGTKYRTINKMWLCGESELFR